MSDRKLKHEIEAEIELSKALAAYVGEWVAVKSHKVVDHAPTLNELLAFVEDDDYDGLFRVPDGEAFFHNCGGFL